MKNGVGSQIEDQRSAAAEARHEALDRRAILVGLGAGAPLLATALGSPAAAQLAPRQQTKSAAATVGVQTSIQIMVDFHGHLKETDQLMALTDSERKDFMRRCALALHGEKLSEFVELARGPEFNPLLGQEASGHPVPDQIGAAMMRAVAAYNRAGFPMQFTQGGLGGPHYTCIQLVWVVDHWVARYNYDLAASNPPKVGELSARYHVVLSYTRDVADIAGLGS